MPTTPPALVVVEWEDASVVDTETWVMKKNMPDPAPIIFQQVGWLLEWNSTHLIMTEAMGDEMMAARNRIPAGMVRSVHVFNVAAGKKLRRPA